jgi:hypothetical protein
VYVTSGLLIHPTPELLAISTEYTVISIIPFKQLQITFRNVMNILNKIDGKQNLRHFGSVVVEMGNNNHSKTERGNSPQ